MTGKADTFADYTDLRGYINARDALGMTPHQALSKGDDGVAASGKITAQDHTPMVALSPDLCEGHKHGDRVSIHMNNGAQPIFATWEDNRPPSGSVNPGTVLELNPAACKALGLTPPGTFGSVTWEWA